MFDSDGPKISETARPGEDTASARPGGMADGRLQLPPGALRRKLVQRRQSGASGAPVQRSQSLSEIATECKDGAQILWELGRLSAFHLASGTFEGDVDIGKAAYYCRLVHPDGVLGMFDFELASRGSNTVHLTLNLYQKTFEMSAASLHLDGLQTPSFTSRGCTLKGLVIGGSATSGSVTIAGAEMSSAAFIRDKTRVEAGSVGLTRLRGHGSYAKDGGGGSVLAGMSFDEVHARGVRYPGLPPTDLDVKQAGLTFDLLWSALGPGGPGSALPQAPAVLPQDSHLQIELDGLHAAGTVDLTEPGGSQGAGGLDHFHVRLIGGDGHELAAITVDGFHAAAASTGGAGSIDQLTVKGQPALVRQLLESDQIKAQPGVRQALDVIRSCGIGPAVGGSLTLQHVGVTGSAGGKGAAKGDLAASFVVPDLGSLDVSLTGFAASLDQAALAAAFDKFTARFTDKDGKELAYAELDGAAGALGGGQGLSGSGGAKSFLVRGDLAGLVQAAQEPMQKLPPQVRGALEAVRQLGLKGQITGGLQGSAAGGTAQVAGDLSFKLDAGATGSAALSLKGFSAGGKGNTAGGSFTRLEAQLLSKDKEAAFFAIDSAAGSEKDQALGFSARKVEVRGDATNLTRLLGAIEKNAAALPLSVKSACQVARSYSLAASGDATLANVQVGDDGHGGQTVRADLGATVQVAGVGQLEAKVHGFVAHAQKGGDKSVAFDRLEVTLRKRGGAEAAFFAAEAQAREGAEAGSFSFKARKIEARGDAASLSALFSAAGTHVKMLPEQVKSAFAAVSEFGVDGKGQLALDHVEVAGDKDGTRAKADLTAGFDLTGAGKVSVVVHGFAGTVTQTAKEVQFDAFEATLSTARGGQAAHLLVTGAGAKDRAADPAADRSRDTAFHAQKVQAEGSAKDLAALFTGVEQHVKALPQQVVKAFDAVREYGAEFQATGSISMADVDLGSADGKVVARGDLSASVQVPDIGALEARLRGNHGGDHPGFDTLDLKLTDQAGGEAATLHVGGVSVDAAGQSVKIATIRAHGDGARLHAVLDPRIQALLPPELARSLAMLDGNQLSTAMSGLSVQQDQSGNAAASADTVVNRAAVNFVDAQGAVYACPDAMLTISGARVQLGPDRKPRQIDAAGMTAGGHFSGKRKSGTIQGAAMLRTGTVKIVMGPGGTPQSVVAAEIQASGEIETAQAPHGPAQQQTRDQKADSLKQVAPVAEEAAGLVKSADIHTQTPIFPGRYGQLIHIGVAPGSMLHVNLVARDHALAAGTGVEFTPPLDLPAWLALRGVNLQTQGTQGVLKTDLKGFFDFSLSKYVTGQKTMALDTSTLVRQVMAQLQRTIADAKEPSASDTAADARWLKEQHDSWAAEAREHADSAADKSAAERRQIADQDAAAEPRSASMADLGSQKGLDVMGTTGTADIDMATGSKSVTVEGVALPAGQDVHLHGQSQGGGQISLSVNDVTVQAGGDQVEAAGVTGQVQVSAGDDGARIRFSSFSLRRFRWDSLAQR